MKSKIVWFTGLSGSGKTTLSIYISKKLKKKKFKVKLVDGDIFRKKNKTNKFTKNEIVKNNLQIIRYVDGLRKRYDYILVSVISPFEKPGNSISSNSSSFIDKILVSVIKD